MHSQVEEFAGKAARKFGPFARVLEIGSRDINGGVRHLFAGAAFTGIDLYEGPGVDIVGDAAQYDGGEAFDAVVTTEVFEHCASWPDLVASAYRALKPDGVLIITCASGNRGAHSALDERPIRADEYYGNVEPEDLGRVLWKQGFAVLWLATVRDGEDLHAVAVKP